MLLGLEQSYRSLLEQAGKPTSYRIIDLSVKLDHFREFPEDDVIQLWEDLQKNYYSATLVRSLVVNHFYLFNVDCQLRQSIGNRLGIRTEIPKMLANRSKRNKRIIKNKKVKKIKN
jgi:hypothetical protein